MNSADRQNKLDRLITPARAWRTLGCLVASLAILFICSGATKYATGIAHYRKHGQVLLNDSSITPGLTRTVSKSSVCSGGSTKQYRKTTQAMKNQVYAEYGVDKKKPLSGTSVSAEDRKHPLFEIDHEIPLELGGADDVRNLWPQPYYVHPGAHEKDALENKLKAMVCADEIELEEAQKEISEDWYAAYLKYVSESGGN